MRNHPNGDMFPTAERLVNSKIRLCSTVNQRLFSSARRAFINQITALRGRPIRPSLLETKGNKTCQTVKHPRPLEPCQARRRSDKIARVFQSVPSAWLKRTKEREETLCAPKRLETRRSGDASAAFSARCLLTSTEMLDF